MVNLSHVLSLSYDKVKQCKYSTFISNSNIILTDGILNIPFPNVQI